MSLVECDAVLFDMDGTLVDSTAVVERVWARWAARHRIDLAQLLALAHGRPTIDTLRIVAPHLANPQEAAALDGEETLDTSGLRPVQGAKELLAALAPAQWAVVTSADRPLAVARLTAAGLPLPEVLVTVEDVPRGKPDPAGYLQAARRLAVDPRRSIVVEDTPVGVEAGQAAGAIVIGVLTTFPDLRGYDYGVRDLRDIRAVRNGTRIEVHLNGLGEANGAREK